MFTQSLMELGAIVCVPNGAPKCEICPCRAFCLARLHGTWEVLPRKEKKAARRIEEKTVFVFLRGKEMAVRKRPEEGLLASLWELPNAEGFLSEPEALKVAASWGVRPLRLERAVRKKHIFTHVEWRMICYYIQCEVRENRWTDFDEIGEDGVSDDFGSGLLWAGMERIAKEFALPTAFRQFL